MPVRSTRPDGQGPEFSDTMMHFDETRGTLAMRVDRLNSGDAWAEVPAVPDTALRDQHPGLPGREGRGRLEARSNLLLARTRGDEAVYQWLTAERRDIVRRHGAGWRLLRRTILLDVTTLPTYNLAFFL